MVGLETSYGRNGAGFESRQSKEGVSCLWGPPVSCLLGAGVLSRLKRPGCDDHSSPSRAQGKKGWSYVSDPTIRLHGVDEETFTFAANSRSINHCITNGNASILMKKLS